MGRERTTNAIKYAMMGLLLGMLAAALLSGCTGYSKLKVLEWEAATGAAPEGYRCIDKGQPFGWWKPGGEE